MMCAKAREDHGYEQRIDNQLRKFIRDYHLKSRAEAARKKKRVQKLRNGKTIRI